MQEGTPAFVTMVKISGAVAAFKDAGLPYIAYLRHPTTGGVLASWGSLGHVTVAEPGATIGFLGARVFEALYGEAFPDDVQTAENLYAHGLLDAVQPMEALPAIAGRFLDIVLTPPDLTPVPEVPKEPPRRRARVGVDHALARPRAAGVRALLKLGASDVVPLFGTGAGEWDRSLFLAVARFEGMPCIVLGQDRRAERAEAPLGPSGLRVARRGMKLATELGLPLVSVIDTAGAALSKEAEEGGMAGEIARCLAELVVLPVPTVCVLLGQGTGGGALALMPADRVVCAQHSWLSPLPPEGASAILHRTPDRAPRWPPSRRCAPRPARGGHRRPDRRRAPGRRRGAGGLLPPDGPGDPARARRPHGARAGRPPRPPRPLARPSHPAGASRSRDPDRGSAGGGGCRRGAGAGCRSAGVGGGRQGLRGAVGHGDRGAAAALLVQRQPDDRREDDDEAEPLRAGEGRVERHDADERRRERERQLREGRARRRGAAERHVVEDEGQQPREQHEEEDVRRRVEPDGERRGRDPADDEQREEPDGEPQRREVGEPQLGTGRAAQHRAGGPQRGRPHGQSRGLRAGHADPEGSAKASSHAPATAGTAKRA